MGHPVGDTVSYRDEGGTDWSITEWVIGSEWPSMRGRRCLVFDSEKIVWRLWRYPSHWRSTPPDQLELRAGAATRDGDGDPSEGSRCEPSASAR